MTTELDDDDRAKLSAAMATLDYLLGDTDGDGISSCAEHGPAAFRACRALAALLDGDLLTSPGCTCEPDEPDNLDDAGAEQTGRDLASSSGNYTPIDFDDVLPEPLKPVPREEQLEHLRNFGRREQLLAEIRADPARYRHALRTAIAECGAVDAFGYLLQLVDQLELEKAPLALDNAEDPRPATTSSPSDDNTTVQRMCFSCGADKWRCTSCGYTGEQPPFDGERLPLKGAEDPATVAEPWRRIPTGVEADDAATLADIDKRDHKPAKIVHLADEATALAKAFDNFAAAMRKTARLDEPGDTFDNFARQAARVLAHAWDHDSEPPPWALEVGRSFDAYGQPIAAEGSS